MKDYRFGKIVIFVNGMVPLVMLCLDAWNRRLGANPLSFTEHMTGMTALIFLMLSLSVTPLRRITGQNWLGHYRKILGLFSFFYALVHLFAYALFDRQFHIDEIVTDTIKRPFILFGMICFLILLALAITSPTVMVKKMGGKRWRRLHQTVYVAAILAVIHFGLFVKADYTLPQTFVLILAILLGARIVFALMPKRTSARPGTANAS